MKTARWGSALILGAVLMAAGCASTGEAVSDKEDLLASAGFVPKRADNPARMAAVRALPPHQFVTRSRNGRTLYLYADPTVCGCIYAGDQTAYNQYRLRMAVRQTATDEQIRAILSSAPLPGEEGL